MKIVGKYINHCLQYTLKWSAGNCNCIAVESSTVTNANFDCIKDCTLAKFNDYHEAQGSHDEVYTDGSKMNERVGSASVINRHFQDGETTCRQLSKRLPDNSTIFAAEATAITLALNHYLHMGPVHHDVVVYSDSSQMGEEAWPDPQPLLLVSK